MTFSASCAMTTLLTLHTPVNMFTSTLAKQALTLRTSTLLLLASVLADPECIVLPPALLANSARLTFFFLSCLRCVIHRLHQFGQPLFQVLQPRTAPVNFSFSESNFHRVVLPSTFTMTGVPFRMRLTSVVWDFSMVSCSNLLNRLISSVSLICLPSSHTLAGMLLMVRHECSGLTQVHPA